MIIIIEGITLYSKATHGLASPDEFNLPNVSALWNRETYQAFDFTPKSKNSKKDKTVS